MLYCRDARLTGFESQQGSVFYCCVTGDLKSTNIGFLTAPEGQDSRSGLAGLFWLRVCHEVPAKPQTSQQSSQGLTLPSSLPGCWGRPQFFAGSGYKVSFPHSLGVWEGLLMTRHLTSPRVSDPKKRERDKDRSHSAFYISNSGQHALALEGVKARRWHHRGSSWRLATTSSGDNII